MVEEHGIVTAIDKSGGVWVETQQQSVCGQCAANKGCGHKLLNKLPSRQVVSASSIKVRSDYSLQVGDAVVIGIPENTLVKGSLLVYLLPLVFMLFTCWLLKWQGYQEQVTILFGFVSLFLSFYLLRKIINKTSFQQSLEPSVLKVLVPIQDTESPLVTSL
ncbi:SoxR reducing system RseC family protein [Endozoicomonas sp. SM1973]|uniref:SoxR reducing system RseC family protein n=1 Tax=Spartinivicinus marinus TaxID=2994442 RepID=A0A853I552_9GAMM|nr:SoxR reducing system RseC family protein [Spartinivicinus marinus]MCX4025497.1 SoxR reducing system RseC family protein [Spartinivicinus marinus]NYZ65274.1 SoxR reducing system RseC family protein [Spartinivicinus marinus]